MKTVKLKIKTPADASAIEGALLKTAHAGHWHDAEVRVDGDAILVSYRDEACAPNQWTGRTPQVQLGKACAISVARARRP